MCVCIRVCMCVRVYVCACVCVLVFDRVQGSVDTKKARLDACRALLI